MPRPNSSSDFDRIARRRLHNGDYKPLWRAWTARQKVLYLLLQRGIPASVLSDIPDHWSHPVMERYMAINGWDVSNIPNEAIEKVSNRILQRLQEVLRDVAPENPAPEGSSDDAVASRNGTGQ